MSERYDKFEKETKEKAKVLCYISTVFFGKTAPFL